MRIGEENPQMRRDRRGEGVQIIAALQHRDDAAGGVTVGDGG